MERPISFAILFLLAAFGISPAAAQPDIISAAVRAPGRPDADLKLDPDRHPAEVLALAGVKSGDTILELIANGYYTRILSKAVGPKGHVYSTLSQPLIERDPTRADALKAIAADPTYSNVTVLVQPAGAPAAPVPVDIVWSADAYHDLHNAGGDYAGDADTFNKMVLSALKPAGTFFVIDHAGIAGSGLTQTGTLHRIEPEVEKREILRAGFVLSAESDLLRNPKDDYTAHWAEKGDRLIFKFRKP